MTYLEERAPEAKSTDIDWPERQRAIDTIRIDGHDHLFVFPVIGLAPDSDTGDRPVDVYSAAGEHLFSGMISIRRWDAARDDYVYGVRTDAATEEYEVVRYRLVEPF
jgi:hypothetical protein